jgi:hypothetical protein
VTKKSSAFAQFLGGHSGRIASATLGSKVTIGPIKATASRCAN